MTKEELIYLTLRQLSDSLERTPENFRLEDPALGSMNSSFHGPTIIWQFKVEMQPGQYIPDPLNPSRTVIVTHNKHAKQLSCHIYFREVNSISHAMMSDTQATQQLLDIPFLNRNYRAFEKLRKKLLKRKSNEEYYDYLKKLNTIFPTVHEEDIFK